MAKAIFNISLQRSQVPTCHVMVSMALTNQRSLRKGWKTPYAPYREWNAFPARLRPAGGDPGIDLSQKYFLTVCVSLSELDPSEPH